MKLFLLSATILACSISAFGQEIEQQVNFLGDPVVTKIRVGNSYRAYYSLDIGFCYLTAIDSIGMKKAWITVAHLFAQETNVRLEYLNLAGGPEFSYVNVFKYLGNDLCQVYLSHDSVYTKIDLPWPGSGFDTSKIFFTALVKNQSELVYSLVDHKKYQILAIFTMVTGEGEIEGFVIDRESQPGDCGSGFIMAKNKELFITIRGLPTKQTIFDPLRERVRGISSCALVVHAGHQGAPSKK